MSTHSFSQGLVPSLGNLASLPEANNPAATHTAEQPGPSVPLEDQFSALRAEMDDHLRREIDRLLTASMARLRSEVAESLSAQVDVRLADFRRTVNTDLESRFAQADSQLQTQLGLLSSRVHEMQETASRIPPDVPMVDTQPVEQSEVITQLHKKNEVIENLRAEISTLRETRNNPRHVDSAAHWSGLPADGAAADDDVDDPQRVLYTDAHTARPRVKLGPRYPGVREIVPENPRYTGVLSYRRYRLVNTDPRVDADVTAQVGLHVRRL